MAERILIVDDDEAVVNMLERVVANLGMEAITEMSGEDALSFLKNHSCDLILLDINMNGIDGFGVVKAIRGSGINTPVIFISGRNEDFDTLYGLDIGADDYISKPFNPVILGAKIKALIRRSKGGLTPEVITAGPFRYDSSTLRLYKDGAEIALSSKENIMMKLFIDNVNRIFSKRALYELVWDNTVVDDNAIMVYISRLRNKIEDNPPEPHYIQTVRGLGYRFVV